MLFNINNVHFAKAFVMFISSRFLYIVKTHSLNICIILAGVVKANQTQRPSLFHKMAISHQ